MDIIMKYGCTIAKVGTYFAQWTLVIQFEYEKKTVHHILLPIPNSTIPNMYRYFLIILMQKNDNKTTFLTFPVYFLIPILFSNLNCNCSNLSYMRNLQEQVKKAFCYQKFFWTFILRTNCSSDLKNFAISLPSTSNFEKIPWSLGQFLVTVGQKNFGDKITIWNRNIRDWKVGVGENMSWTAQVEVLKKI